MSVESYGRKRDRTRNLDEERRWLRKSLGLCVVCAQPAPKLKTMCAMCRHARALQSLQRAPREGQCVDCGVRIQARYDRCNSCQSAFYLRLRAKGRALALLEVADAIRKDVLDE